MWLLKVRCICECIRYGFANAGRLATVCYRKAARGWRMLKPLLVSSRDPCVTGLFGARLLARLGLIARSLLGVALVGAFITSLQARRERGCVSVQIILLAAALISGARPLQDWRSIAKPRKLRTQFHGYFYRGRILNQALAQAKGKPALISTPTGAACKEFEKYTFSDPRWSSRRSATRMLFAGC